MANVTSDIKSDKRIRNTKIELLRIISMLLIVAYHAMRNGFTDPGQPIYIYSYTAIFGSWGILGVDLFVIISAWFLCEQQFRAKKVIHIVFQVFTWVLLYAIVYFVYRFAFCQWSIKETIVEFSSRCVAGFFQPFWSGYYWFVTTYFFMLLASPFLNKVINGLDRSGMSKLLIVFSFIPIYAQFSSGKVGDIFSFIYIYLLIGYVKKYGSSLIQRFAKLRYIALLMVVVVLAKIGLRCFESDNTVFAFAKMLLSNTLANCNRNSMIMLVISILVFFYTLTRKVTYNKFVNRIASCTFGVYLFHGNGYFGEGSIIDRIYAKLLDIGFLSIDGFFPIKHLLIVICIFIAGVVIELIRDAVLQKPFMNFITKHFSVKLKKADVWFNELEGNSEN